MTRSALLVIAAGLVLLHGGPVRAEEIPDRRYLVVPPAYPVPPPGFVRLPRAGVPVIPREPGAPTDRPVWNPGRTDVVIGLDARGRVTSILEYTPGRFGR